MNIEEILTEGAKRGASDVHIVCVLPPTIRVNGKLLRLDQYGDIDPQKSWELLTAIINEEQTQRLKKDLALDFSFAIRDVGRFRCNYFFQRGSLAGAFRLISKKIFTLDELGLPKQVEEFATYPRGLILVQIESVSYQESDLFQRAIIRPAIDFRRLETVLVITDFPQPNLEELEEGE